MPPLTTWISFSGSKYPMQGEKRTIPCFRLGRRITIAATVLVFLACSVCAQDQRQRQQESEKLFSAAIAAERRNDPIEAELRYEECRELAQRYRLPKMEAAALHRLAVIRARNKRFTESANLFRRAIELDPRNALVLSDFAQLHIDRKDFGEAEIILKNALNIDPNNPKVLFNLGVVIATQRGERQTEGLRYLKLAVGEADAYRELARIYRSKGDISRAEFADQKAKIAESQRSDRQPNTSRILATAPSDNDSVSVRPPQRATHQPQTPPEVVDRVRQELIEKEVRNIAEAQRNAAAPPVTQLPFIPAPVNPATHTETTASPREAFPAILQGQSAQIVAAPITAIMPQSQSPSTQVAATVAPSGPPADPFAMAVRPQEPSSTSVRRLEPPPVTIVPVQPAVRTIPSPSGPPPTIQSLDRNETSNTVVFDQTAESKATNNDESMPQIVRIASSAQPGQHLFRRTQTSAELPRQISLPPTQASSNGDGHAERVESVNPLRQIHANRTGLTEPGTDVPSIALLPSYYAMGTQRILRTDRSDLPERSGNAPVARVPNSNEPQLGRIVALRAIEGTERAEGVHAPRPLPVRDVDVLQSPSAVIARQETPGTGFVPPNFVSGENTLFAASVRSEQAAQEVPEPQYVRIIQSDRRFSSATTPDVLSFAPVRRDPPPAIHADVIHTDTIRTEESLEVAVRPLESGTLPPTASLPVRLPQIEIEAGDADYPTVVAINPPMAPSAPTVGSADPFQTWEEQQELAEVRRIESQPPSVMPVPPTDPFPATNDLPRLADARTVPSPLPPLAAREIASPRPVQETPVAGFASSRRAGQAVNVSNNDESAGFARSRR